MPGLIGKKLGMTSVYSAEGENIPCTIIEAGPCVITQVKKVDTDGYEAVQIAYGERKEKNTPKALQGHFKKSGTTPKRKVVEVDGLQDSNVGDQVTVDMFIEGEWVDVIGTSKGKGFQGVVKRHGFAGVGDATHGQHNRLRAPGSLGAGSTPSRVMKGMKMAGRMGGKRVKQVNLEVVKVYNDKNLIVLKGSIPGPKGSYVVIEK